MGRDSEGLSERRGRRLCFKFREVIWYEKLLFVSILCLQQRLSRPDEGEVEPGPYEQRSDSCLSMAKKKSFSYPGPSQTCPAHVNGTDSLTDPSIFRYPQFWVVGEVESIPAVTGGGGGGRNTPRTGQQLMVTHSLLVL